MTLDVEGQLPLDSSDEPTQDLDFTGVDLPSRVMVPAGVYNAVVKDVERKYGRESNEPYLQILFTLTDSEVDGTPVQDIVSFSAKAKPWSKLRLETILGEPIPSVVFPWPESRDRLIGRPVRLKLAPTEYQGVRDMDVKAILAPESRGEARRGSLF